MKLLVTLGFFILSFSSSLYHLRRKVRDLENEDVRVRGVMAQELREVFPEHIQILDELKYKEHGINFENFHQVDKQVRSWLLVC